MAHWLESSYLLTTNAITTTATKLTKPRFTWSQCWPNSISYLTPPPPILGNRLQIVSLLHIYPDLYGLGWVQWLSEWVEMIYLNAITLTICYCHSHSISISISVQAGVRVRAAHTLQQTAGRAESSDAPGDSSLHADALARPQIFARN